MWDAVVSPMAHLPVGATFGSLVHAVLEHADPEAPDLRAELLAQIHQQLVRWPAAVDVDELADALVLVCDSSLGPLAGGLSRARTRFKGIRTPFRVIMQLVGTHR
jgi:exodeoxyribonuclease V beta subunit